MASKFSLIDFVDRANEELFFHRKLSSASLGKLTDVIALQGLPGSYAGMFAIPEVDRQRDLHTFTGEVVKSNAARMHIIGEETCRILRLCGSSNAAVKSAYKHAIDNMSQRIHEADLSWGKPAGVYCCGTCTCSYWRNLAAGSFDKHKLRLKHGLQELKKMRQDNGRWRRYPFYYTLLAMSEIDQPVVKKEIEFAMPQIEKLLTRRDNSPYAERRQTLLKRIIKP